jgi:hypothetical protein
MGYTRAYTDWKDLPDTTTPITAAKLNPIDQAVYDLKTASFYPKDYGSFAVGGVTDCTSAINAAIDAASQYAAGGGNGGVGGIVQLPGGQIRTTSPLRLKDGVWIRGSGTSTDIRSSATGAAFAPVGSGVLPDNIMVTDLVISPSVGDGILLDFTGHTGGMRLGWARCTMQNVTVVDGPGWGFNQPASGGGIETRYVNCVAMRCAKGFNIGQTDNFLIGCTAAEGTAESGFKVGGGNNKLAACKAYGGDGSGFSLAGAGRHMLVACESQDNTLAGFLIDGNWNSLAGCIADTNLRAGFEFLGGNSTVDGVSMSGGGGSGYTTKVGFLFSATTGTGHVVVGKTNAISPVAGMTAGNDIRVFQNNGGGRAAVTYAATITPDPYTAEIHAVTLTGNVAVAASTNKHVGQRMTLEFLQDGTGGRTITFSGLFRTNWTPDTAANKLNVITFEYDGQFWRQVAAATGLTAGGAGVADTFNRANGAIGTSSSGHVWATSLPGGGSWTVASNVAVTSGATSFQRSAALLDAGVADYTVQVTSVASSSGVPSVVWRWTDANNYMMLFGNTLRSLVAGVETQLAGGIVNLVAGDTVKVEVSGATIRIYKNGVLSWVDSCVDNLTATKAGVVSHVNGDSYDNFSIT